MSQRTHNEMYGRTERIDYSQIKDVKKIPYLIELQKKSYEYFLNDGLKEVFTDFSPIVDGQGKWTLELLSHSFDGKPKYTERQCKDRDVTYSVPLTIRARLTNNETGEIQEQDVYLGDLPVMTDSGSFIINGAERVVVSQLIKGPSVYNKKIIDKKSGEGKFNTTISPTRGAWLEFEQDDAGALHVRVDKNKKVTSTLFLRALGYGSNAKLMEIFNGNGMILNTLKKDPQYATEDDNIKQSKLALFARLRQGEITTIEGAETVINNLLFDYRRYDLGKVGRYKYNKKLSIANRIAGQTLAKDVVSETSGEVLAKKGQVVSEALANEIQNNAVNVVYITCADPEQNVFEGKVLMQDFYVGSKLVGTCGELITQELAAQIIKNADTIFVGKEVVLDDKSDKKTTRNVEVIVEKWEIGKDSITSTLKFFNLKNKKNAEKGKENDRVAIYSQCVSGFDDEAVELLQGPTFVSLGKGTGYYRVYKVIGNNTVDLDAFVSFDPKEAGVTEKVYYPELKELMDEYQDEDLLKNAISTDLNALVTRNITRDDIISAIDYNLGLELGFGSCDDIDHLSNRRVRAVGELLQNQFRIGMTHVEKFVRDKMAYTAPDASVTAKDLINNRPITSAIKSFFGSSQLSQFMDQPNPIAELTHKRKLSALGPNGLSRERAGVEVRDVHHSHYGRMCPIETPEGQNIGLITSLSSYARVDDYGFIKTPYLKIAKFFLRDEKVLVYYPDVEEAISAGAKEKLTKLAKAEGKKAEIIYYIKGTTSFTNEQKATDQYLFSVVTEDSKYYGADEEDKYVIAQANEPLDEDRKFKRNRANCRIQKDIREVPAKRADLMDVNPKQLISIATALIPFLENDDTNRALMGSNMQRQAVPLLKPEAPIIATGVEHKIAYDSGILKIAKHDGVVSYVDSDTIIVKCNDGTEDTYKLNKFERSNQSTCMNQKPIVNKGDKVVGEVYENGELKVEGTILADGTACENGELALGRNMLIGFMSWEGYNYEDAVLLSEELVQDDVFTSIHIEEHEMECRDTQLGEEEITRDIPNLSDDALKYLDQDGIIMIGAEVKPGDILVGKVTPKGETELSPEERLLRAIFGEKSREVRDTSLRVPNGQGGVVVDVKVFTRKNKDELTPGVNKLVRVYIAQKRKISVGDKMAGRHGNKGVVSRILPKNDMPFLADGTPLQIVLNPLGVPSRMNIGQVLEVHLGLIAKMNGWKIATPVFDGANEQDIKELFKQNGIVNDKGEVDGKLQLYDGRTGEPFENRATVGYMYYLKLHHLVDDKMHARSIGPYSLVTQQPLGGKAQFGGQRFGEMEVWAIEAYGASNILQEILTVKSDDVAGRTKMYESIVKGNYAAETGIPESFKVLTKELNSLGLDITVKNEDNDEIVVRGDDYSDEELAFDTAPTRKQQELKEVNILNTLGGEDEDSAIDAAAMFDTTDVTAMFDTDNGFDADFENNFQSGADNLFDVADDDEAINEVFQEDVNRGVDDGKDNFNDED